MLAFLPNLVTPGRRHRGGDYARRAREVSNGRRAVRAPSARKPGNTGGIFDRIDRAAGARRQDRDGAPVTRRDRDDAPSARKGAALAFGVVTALGTSGFNVSVLVAGLGLSGFVL